MPNEPNPMPNVPDQRQRFRRLALPADRAQRAYLQVRDALMRHQDGFLLVESPQVTNALLRAALDDTPELFWFEGTWQAVTRDGRPEVRPVYTCSRQEALRRARELELALGEVRSRIPAGDLSRVALWLYDWMRTQVRYGRADSAGQTSYDALVRRVALCKGIAKGYQLLLAQAGIRSSLVHGSIGGHGRHVWNCLHLGPTPLYVDISLARSWFDQLFAPDERDNPHRCFLMDRAAVRSHGVLTEEEMGRADADPSRTLPQ